VLENVILGAEDGALLGPALAKARDVSRPARGIRAGSRPRRAGRGPVGRHQQRVEILKALYRHADILILDEPTGVLTPSEADHLFRILRNLRDEGKTIILITHKLREIMEVTDTVSVMRRGEMTATLRTADTTPEELAEAMVGRKVLAARRQGAGQSRAPHARGRATCGDRCVGGRAAEGRDLPVDAGEILGIAGVAGNGQSRTAGGSGRHDLAPATGTLNLDGRPLDIRHGDLGPGAPARRASPMCPRTASIEGLIMAFRPGRTWRFGYHNDPAYNRGPL
jgi:ABC-type uncharacterized transport system ATPase subunit